MGGTIAALNLTAGTLFLLRRTPSDVASLRDSALCLGSVIMGGVALKMAPPVDAWNMWPALAFAVCGLLAIGSLAALGQSFAVFPSYRGLVQRGPFRLIRHPIYACETLMIACCSVAGVMAAQADPAAVTLSIAPTLLALVLVIVRIRIEEDHLTQASPYAAYREQVRWRLLPGIW